MHIRFISRKVNVFYCRESLNILKGFMPSRKPQILFVMGDDLFNRIDDFRFENRIMSRSEAVRILVEEGLKKYEKQEKKPKK
jgi:nicotinic acid mononucleotide adenylyltransferase